MKNELNKPLDIKVKAYNRLFLKVYFNYAVMLLVFAVLLGFIFMKLFENSTMKIYSARLENDAKKISERVSEFVETDDAEYASYVEILIEMNAPDTDVWIISNAAAKNPMSDKFENIKIKNIDLEENHIQDVIQDTFNGEIMSKTCYMPIYGNTMRVVGYPIYNENKEVIGGVLLSSQKESQADTIDTSQKLIYISAAMGLFISFIIAILFARKLSQPIVKMRKTALILADGNYNVKTGIEQKDEIGDLATTIDILAERLLENEQERKNMEQMRLDFFANVSHELRTPITVVRAYVEMLVDGVVTDSNKVANYYDRMLKECKSMERLVGDLLILSKMQNPDFEIEKEPINLIQIFEDIIRSIHAISKKKNISIEISKEQESYIMLGDYDRIRQMFLVIIDNAIKFSDINSSIYINLSYMDKLIISIEDQGIGISEEELPHIFEKFYKSKLRQNATGSGLGLAIANQICLRHGGNIKVESMPHQGTKFTFEFDTCMSETELEEYETTH
ncbi:sensor histidine kinase [Anaeromicropila herbilytica]|uniref:histidine kinase n=1 Tax=Anaeromicropila herbilytica TaxID=2785025 RepID=A0A7R7ENP5_9FIRM|nr:ATP-binding protein [Anaeromicropila herbilytica]BCN32157.1 two-component sensor histidine kinase [Anaeromicropila herbilytica]